MAAVADHPRVRSTDLGTKREIAGAFFSMASPRIITLAAVATLTARLVLGHWSVADLIAIAGVILFIGPLEWTIHLFLLHCDPGSFQARNFGAGVSHGKHHLDPPDLEFLLLSGTDAALFTVILGLSPALWAIPVLWLTGSAIALPLLTAAAAGYIAFGNYEWTHLMVHTRYRPKTRLYARLARNHRLHHYRNENYWLGVTSNLGDRLMRTLPAAKTDVPLSDTARTLQ